MSSPKAMLSVLCYSGSMLNLHFDDKFTASQKILVKVIIDENLYLTFFLINEILALQLL